MKHLSPFTWMPSPRRASSRIVMSVRFVGLLAVVGLLAAGPAASEEVDPELAEIDDGIKRLGEDLTRLATRTFLPIVSEIIYDPKLSSKCAGSLLKIGTALRSSEMWVIQMLDSNGRPPAGLMSGRIADYGAYDQCLEVRHPDNAFQGKYCMLHANSNKFTPLMHELGAKFLDHIHLSYAGNLSGLLETEVTDILPLYKLGVCIPSTCRKEDLQFILDTVLSKYKLQISAAWCEVQHPVVLDNRQIVIIAILGAWMAIILLGTAFDFYHSRISNDELRVSTKPRQPNVLSKALLGFSVRRSILKLVSLPAWGDYSNELGYVHGMRVLSATWVILGHTYIVRDQHYSSNMLIFLRRIQHDIAFSVQMNSFMAVSSFFAMTGFLSGYLVCKTPPPKKVPFYLLVIIGLVRRYIRLVPSLMAILGVMYLIPLLVSGPLLNDMWPMFERPCTKHWWRILTMTHNYMDNPTDLCLPHYWYISVDFQLAVFSTILLAVVMPRWPKVALGISGAIVISCTIATGVMTYINDYMPLTIIISTRIRTLIDTAMYIYNRAFPHAPALFVGIIFGSLAVKRHRMSRNFQALCWLIATISSSASLFGIYTWHHGRAPERLESAVYAGLHRLAWAVGVCWVMYACTTGRGGIVNKILAWPIFYPFGRLSFAVYVVHLVVLSANAVLARERKSNQPFLQGQDYIASAITSYAFATLLYLFVECPIAGLDNLVFGGLRPPSQDVNKDGSKDVHQLKSIQVTNGAVSNGAPPKHTENEDDDQTYHSKAVNGNGMECNGHRNDNCHYRTHQNESNGHVNNGYTETIKF